MSTDLLLLALVSDVILPDGFAVLRLRDLTSVEAPAPTADFVKAALRLRGKRIPRTPKIALRSFASVLTSAGRVFPLVTIHRETVDPDVCQIGIVRKVSRTDLVLQEIDPEAQWYPEEDRYKLREITRVDFGGLYEDALALVASRHPA